MMNLMKQLNALTQVCDEDERALIEEMVINAGDYVQAVINTECKRINYTNRGGDEFRKAFSEADSRRTIVHNSLISMVDTVNKLCQLHDLSPIYTGDNQRRHYGDFAQKLVNEIFDERK